MSHLVSRRSMALLAGSLLAAAVACGPGSDEGSAPAAPPAADATPAPAASAEVGRAEAEQIYTSRCVTCHGTGGAGDGPASAGLTPTPRDLRDPAWQTSVSDEHIEQIVLYGGAAGGLSPARPANPGLMSKPEGAAALRAHVRALARD